MFSFPDMNQSFNMYTTLVREFHRHGHEIVVVAPGNKKTGVYQEDKIDVLRVKTFPLKNVIHYLKGFSNLLLPLQYYRALKKFYPSMYYDAIITQTPPITLTDLVSKIKRISRAQVYLILRDIFPKNAVDLGFLRKSSLLYKFFRAKEKLLYQIADHIGCMSEGNIRYILEHNPEVNHNKLHELKNFQIPFNASNDSAEDLRKRYDLIGRFVVVFGGNMGKPQQLENVLRLALSVQDYSDIMFLLIGEGVEMKRIERMVKEKDITNVIIKSSLPKNDYQALLSVCQVGLISLHINFTIPNIPSKSLDYFNIGIPVLASLDYATDFGKIIDDNKLGFWAYADQPDRLKERLLVLYKNEDLRKELGKNARTYFLKNLTPQIAYNTVYERIKYSSSKIN